MKQVKFGLFAPQVAVPFSTIRERAQQADRAGYDSVWFVDHMWARGMPDFDHLEAWTLMSATAALTDKIGIGTLVLCNSYRNPALLAKMACSLDHVSGGRLRLGLGAGWMDEEYRAYGYPFPSTRVRLEQLEEALQIIKAMFTEKRASFQGKYYTIEDAANEPKPVQKPHPPILIGGAGEKRLLRLVARYADIWNCPNNAATEFERKYDILKQHCASVGRDADEIEVSEQSIVVLGRDDADLKQKRELAESMLGAMFDIEKTGFVGTPDRVADQLQRRVEQGVTFFTMLFGDLNSQESVELFAEKVAPALADN